MDDAWNDTKSFVQNNQGYYKEYGFCIYAYLDRDVQELRIDSPFKTSIKYDCGESLTLELDIRENPSDDPSRGGKYLIGQFHTHPPLTYCPSDVIRDPTGPSSIDESNLREILTYAPDYYRGKKAVFKPKVRYLETGEKTLCNQTDNKCCLSSCR